MRTIALLVLISVLGMGCENDNNTTIVIKDDAQIDELNLIEGSDRVTIVSDSPSSFDNEVSGDSSSNDIEHRANDPRDQ